MQRVTFEHVDLIATPSSRRLGGGLTAEEARINFEPEIFRRVKLDDDFEEAIAKVWSEKTSASGPARVYNAAKFR